MGEEFHIERREKSLRNLRGWILIYGRIRTGKTFLLRRFFSGAYYFAATRAGYIIFEENNEVKCINVKDAVSMIGSLLRRGETVILEEFQRISDKFLNEIAANYPNGKLIASTSSIGMSKKILDGKNPFSGLFTPFKIDLIKYSDTIFSLSNVCSSPINVLLYGLIIRDPWIIPMISFKRDAVSEIHDKIGYFLTSASGLIGEVFREEERSLTRVYDAVLKLVGGGFWKPAVIADILSSNNLISGGLPTVTGLLERLVDIELLEKIPLWKTKGSKCYFKHKSPLLSIIYEIDQKLGISEGICRRMDKSLILSILEKEFKFSLGEMLSEYLGGIRSCIVLPDNEENIDIVILDRRKKPIIGYKVKLDEFKVGDAEKSIEIIHSHGIPKAGLISASAKPPSVKESFMELGPEELINIAKQINLSLTKFGEAASFSDRNVKLSNPA